MDARFTEACKRAGLDTSLTNATYRTQQQITAARVLMSLEFPEEPTTDQVIATARLISMAT